VTAGIAVITTGGTIDSLGRTPVDLAWYTEDRQRLDPGDLVGGVLGLHDFANITEIDFPRRPSHMLGTADWLLLARKIDNCVRRSDIDGVVVTHGTNTLEETAYFLHLVAESAKPVILVGAMRPANGLGTDAYLNLMRAIQVAAAPEAAHRGVLVVMNDTIFGARDVTKTATFRVDSFAAPDTGPLGYADADGKVVFYHWPERVTSSRGLFPGALTEIKDLPRVDIVVSYVGADGALIDAAVGAGARGIISAGTGNGMPTAGEKAAFDRAITAGAVVCQSTRVASGRVARSVTMADRGIVAADNLRPWKARVLLALALTRTNDSEAIQTIIDRC